jgi:hypothetical protein
MPLGSTLDMDLLDEDKNLREIDDDEHGAFVSALAGIGSGLFKIPEQFVSLGAELIDLGLDTDTAASVESFFDKINPFDEIAESTTAGKLTETFVSLGIPTTAGYSLASRLAGKALKAKRLNQYVDLKRFGNAKTLTERKEALRLEKLRDPVTGKRRRVNDALLEEVERLSPIDLKKRVFKDKAYVFGAGLGGGGLADFVFADPDIGTLGDEFGGITRRDTQETFGRDEAVRELTNRLKFAGEGAILTSVIGGVGKGIAKGAGAIKYKMQYDALDNSIKKIIADFAPQGVKPREIFELLETRKNELGKFQVEGQAFGRQLELTVDNILKQTGKTGDEFKLVKQQFGEAINSFLTSGNRTGLDNYLLQLGVDNPELTKKLFTGIDNARSTIDNYSNAILKIIPDNEEFKFLRQAIKDNLGEYTTTRYALIERHGALGKAFAKFKPTDEAYKKAYDYVLKQIGIGKRSLAEGIDASDQKFKGIAPQSGVAPEDQAKQILNKLLQEDITQGTTNLPGADALRSLGLTIDDKILKEKKLPEELKEFFGEIKNPFYNISSTIAKQGALITEVEMLGQLGKLAKGKIFFETADEAARALNARSGDIVPVGRLSKTVNIDQDISGLYTTKEIADAFAGPIAGAEAGALSKLYSFFVLAPKSASQQAKTIFSPFTHVRNLLSASAFTLLNGNISFTNPGRTADAFKKSFNAFKKGRDSQEAFDLYLDYTRRGITGTNPVLGEIMDLGARLQPVNNFGADKSLNNTFDVVADGFRKLRGKITDTYMAEDDFWKIYNYNFEQGNYNNFMSKFIMRNPELKEMGEARGKETVSKLIRAFKDIENTPRTVVDAQGRTVINPAFETVKKNRLNIVKAETGIENDKAEAVMEQLRKKVGRLMGRRDISFNDPIFYQPKNTLKRLEGESDASYAGRLGDDVLLEEDAVEALVKNLSADVTKNNIPNYAYVGDNIKALRKLPLGTFVAFPAEIIRTGFNTIQRAAREMAVAETRDIGIRRATGVLGTGAALPVGAVELGKQLSQFTNEEMAALRRFVPSWSENSLLVPTGRDEKTGNVQYLDLSYIYPYDSLLRPMRTVMNQLVEGEATDAAITARLTEGGVKAMAELAKPFLSEAIFIEAANDLLLRGGRTRQGSQVFRGGDPLGEKLFKATMHIMDTFTPGSVDQALRIGGAPFNVADKYGRTYDLADEAMGIFGFRNIEVDPAESFKFMVGDFNKRVSSARATFLGDVLKGGAVTPEQILKEYLGAEESRFNAYQDMFKNYKAAETLGIKPIDLNRQLDRLPKKTRGAILSGTYQPYKPSKEVRKLFYENSLRLAQRTGSAPIDPLQGSLSKIYEYIAANNGRSLLSDLNVNFDIPQGSAIDNLIDFFGLQTAQQTAPQKGQPISSSSGTQTKTGTGTQNLDSALAIDTLIGDDPLLQEIANKRNT